MLLVKLHQPPSSPAKCGHFAFAVVHVGTEHVMMEHDGLKHEGLPQMSATSEWCVTTRSQVWEARNFECAQVRVIRDAAVKHKGRDEAMKLLLPLTTQAFRLKWETLDMLAAIPPLDALQSIPSCSLDACTMDALVANTLCSSTLVEWHPDWSQAEFNNKTFDSERDATTWPEHLRFNIATAMCAARALCTGGINWPGNEEDNTKGLPLDRVNHFVWSLPLHLAILEIVPSWDHNVAALEARLAGQRQVHFESKMATAIARRVKVKMDSTKPIGGSRLGGRESARVAKKESFMASVDTAVLDALSGQQGCSQVEWRDQLLKVPALSSMTQAEISKMQEGQLKAARAQLAQTMWVVDLCHCHPQMKEVMLIGGCKLKLSMQDMKLKMMEQPISLRPYNLVPYFAGFGKSLSCVAFEFPDNSRKLYGGDTPHLTKCGEVMALAPFMCLVETCKRHGARSFEDVAQVEPEVLQPHIFTLALLQVGDEKSYDRIKSEEDCSRVGVIQVLCGDFGPSGEVTLFTERLDEILSKYWVDPLMLGQLGPASDLAKKHKMYGVLFQCYKAGKEGKSVAEVLAGWGTRGPNANSNAPMGALRLESFGPLSSIQSTSVVTFAEVAAIALHPLRT